MAYPFLSISPSQLEFLFDADQELKSTLTFRGCQEGARIAFKIKITNSERFVVCPPYGIVEPQSTRFVRVYLRAPSRYEDSLKFSQDRFLVQSIQVDNNFDEKKITSDLFRTRDRQEVKLKVVVSAPLAHSTILENEIRTIAEKQGVEGHRAVLRKFSELLLAKGVISQSQVALAFSAVGEIFQNMSAASKEDPEEQEKTFQRFLQRGTSDSGRSNSSSHQPLSHQSLMPKQYHSGSWAADYRPSNLPSRASVPAKEAPREFDLKSHHSASDASRRYDGAESQNGGGMRSSLSTASSESHIPEERRSTAHPAVSRLNLTNHTSISHQTRSSLLDDTPLESSSVEEAERPEELEPTAYDAFAPSPHETTPDEDVTPKNDEPQGRNFGRVQQGVVFERQQSAELQDPELLERLERQRQRNDIAPLPTAPLSPTFDSPDSSARQAKERKPGTDSLGRDFSLMIDRLATPAIRKQKHANQARPAASNRGNDSGAPLPMKDQAADIGIQDNEPSTLPGNTKRGVFIPSGNTMQKANMFR